MIGMMVKSPGLIGVAALVAGIAGAGWYVSLLRSDLVAARLQLSEATSRATAAEAAAGRISAQAEAAIASRDRAHAERLDAISRIQSAQDQCLEARLPAGLLD